MSRHEISRRAFLGTVGVGLAVPAEAVAGAAQAADASQGATAAEKNVVYGKGGEIDLHCDVYPPPASNAKRTAIVHFHGGGFARGSKEALANRLKALTSRGYVNIA